MRKPRTCTLIVFSSILLIAFCFNTNPASAQEQQIQNLRAFAKLYGYIKFFHPSDPASQIDWDKFAIYGCERVNDAQNINELKTTLEELFRPIAPTVQIYISQEKPEPLIKAPQDKTAKIVAWQHLGVGLGGAKLYKSIRTNRENIVATAGSSFGTVTQSVGAKEFRGKQIKITASVKANVSGSSNQGQLWLRVDRENKQMGFFDNMHDRPIKSNEWHEYEIAGDVADDAIRIVFGCFLNGMGQIWIDDFKLLFKEANGDWKTIQIENPGFETETNGKPAMWSTPSQGYTYQISNENPCVGMSSCLIENMGSKYTGVLFAKMPKIGELIDKELCEGLFCQIPLALPSERMDAHGGANREAFAALSSKLKQINTADLTADSELVRLAGIVIAWNVFQHFYPYFDVVETDWDATLPDMLKKALADKNEEDFYDTLRLLVAMIHDGHGGVYSKLQNTRAGFPFLIDWIEDKAIIVFPKDTNNFNVGDIVVSIDGIPAQEVLAKEEMYISGSPQWKRSKALHRFGYGKEGSTAKIIIKRDNQTLEITAARNTKEYLTEPKEHLFEEIEDGIFYVDLDKVDMPEIAAKMDELANAKGVIFDLRGYPKNTVEVISHLLTEADTSSAWMRTPRIVYPDRENMAGYMNHAWFIPAQTPHIKGKVVFITDGRAISYAESYMSFIEHYRLGDIVGQPTAGTNGNVNAFNLPGGFRITWTGMKVVKHDGSQHHLIGVLPTVPAKRTIGGIRDAAKQPSSLFDRLIGYQANVSSLDHADLDSAEQLQTDEVSCGGMKC
jgi:C-terminal processing protease CtpA/Prc